MHQCNPIAFLAPFDTFKAGGGIGQRNFVFAFGNNAGTDQRASWRKRSGHVAG